MYRRLVRSWPVMLAFLLPAVIEFLAASQGINLLDDGLWLLGGDVVADGGVLYRDLFAIYGPAKFVLLAGFLLVVGRNGLALVALKAVTVGLGSALGYQLAQRRGHRVLAWIVPLGALALEANRPRYLAAGALALLAARCFDEHAEPRRWLLLGLAWAGLASFGFDAAGYGGVIILGTWVLTRSRRPSLRMPTLTAAGFAGGLAVLALAAALTGALGPAVWDTVTYPLTRFGAEMGLSPVETFRTPEVAGQLFAEHQTGEAFTPAWPGHVGGLILARRLLYLSLIVLPLFGIWTAWCRGNDPTLAAVAAFALAGWSTAAVRGEPIHLACGWLGTLWLMPLLVPAAPAQRRRAASILVLALAAVAFLPLAAEPVWLAVNADRDGLAVWERDTGGIRLTDERIETLEVLGDFIQDEVDGPAVFWPVRPGLNFFFDVPLATSQATLLGGEVRDVDAVVADLASHPDHVLLLGTQPGSERRSNKDVAPALWASLRRTHLVTAYLSSGSDDFAILTPAPSGSSVDDVPLGARLFDERCTIGTSTTPTLTPGLWAGQSFPVSDYDLAGVAVRLVSDRDATISLAVRVRELDGERPTRQLALQGLRIPVATGQHLYHLPLTDVLGSADKMVLVEFSVNDADGADVRLLWHAMSRTDVFDHYLAGRSWLDGHSLQGDIYFLSF